MTTPIYDFLRSYAEKDGIRLHMPGHKGQGPLGVEALDITEIAGADVLAEADGIIGESEKNGSLAPDRGGCVCPCGRGLCYHRQLPAYTDLCFKDG